MSDFDARLSAVLTAEAEAAPRAVALARAARERQVARRRRRFVAGGVATVLAVAAPVVLLYVGDDVKEPIATDTISAGGWQTIEHHEILVEVPETWSELDCPVAGDGDEEVALYGPPGADGCVSDAGYLSLYAAEKSEVPGVIHGPGRDGTSIWGGYVEAGDWGTGVWSTERAVTLRILASARLAGQPEVVADAWEEIATKGIAYRAPIGWGVDAKEGDGYEVRVDDEISREKRLLSSEQVDDAHYRLEGQLPDRLVTIIAPTLAVAQLVWATIEQTSTSPPDGADELPCDPGMGDPQSGPSCPHGFSTGTLSLGEDGNVVFDGVGGSPYGIDLSAVEVCSGVIQVDYREPLADHLVACTEFPRVLEEGAPPIPVVVWEDGGDIVQLSELYRP